MITRGYFIGDVLDELSSIAHHVQDRCALGLTDLNIYLETFFKEILNKILNIKLQNLNIERSNEPGIDLGDKASKMAFQVTSQKTSAKVNETLSKIISSKIADYDYFAILIIGHRQRSYFLDHESCDKLSFNESNIWDINTLCKKAVDLPIDVLQDLHTYLKQEVARVKLELEIPDREGKYPTSVLDYVEAIPKPTMSDFKGYFSFHKSRHPEWELTIEETATDFALFIKALCKLPRITREFYSFLLERRDEGYHEVLGGGAFFRFNYDRVRRICHYRDLDGEVRLLREHGFIEIEEPNNENESAHLKIVNRGESNYFMYEFVEFIEEIGLRFLVPIVHLDFSAF